VVARDPAEGQDDAIVDLLPVVQKVVAARIRDPHVVEDMVQETIARVVAHREKIRADDLAPYAAVTARHVVASYVERNERAREKAHLLVEVDAAERPGDGLLRQEDRAAVQAAVARLEKPERELLVAHEVDGEATAALAERWGTNAGAVAARLARIRAKLRVEYLLVHEAVEPPTDECRPVLRAISAGDRRRARELDAHGHLLRCRTCARLARRLTTARPARSDADEVRVPISADADVVTARQKGKEIAAPLGFSTTDCTIIATAISEVARNIVKFARRGEVVIDVVHADGKAGVRVVARDAGPGIPDVDRALEDGYSTYQGLGLGLPGARRIMDDFQIESTPGEGTTVTMKKWPRTPAPVDARTPRRGTDDDRDAA
jgi:RNA polymerase sigma factor (sigma-70 family)